jgi:invasion protein IalB
MYVGVCMCVCVCRFQLISLAGAAQQFHSLWLPIYEATPIYLDVEEKLLVIATFRLSSFKVVQSRWAVNCMKSEQHSRDSDICSTSVTLSSSQNFP